jgi:hypothetical protein
MSGAHTLISATERYAKREGIAVSTASTRIFNDGKVIERLKRGGDITTRRFNRAMATMHPGVVFNFPLLLGTGAGSIARDLFSQEAPDGARAR